jgi:hypothetical protein
MKITFTKVARDLSFNKRDQNAVIYDFDILVDGVKVAKWMKLSYKRGYVLTDLDGIDVRAPFFDTQGRRRTEDSEYQWHRIEADLQAEFTGLIVKEFDYIPTPSQIENRRQQAEATKQRPQAA